MGEAADVVRAAFDRANAGDPDGLAALCHEAVEFHDVPEIPGSTTYRGRDGIREWLRTVREVSDDLQLQIRALAERQDAVLVETSAEMSGRASGAAVGWRFWTVWRVRDGLITYHHGYSRRQDAVADLEGG
ncbi:MAG: nuclear transport factor 2 family protein [Solirubrobacterales bacterium]